MVTGEPCSPSRLLSPSTLAFLHSDAVTLLHVLFARVFEECRRKKKKKVLKDPRSSGAAGCAACWVAEGCCGSGARA